MKNKICAINCYYGNWPDWFDYVLKSIRENSSIDWIFFTDNEIPGLPRDNVKYYKLTVEDFNRLASTKLGFEIDLMRPYKLCDFKPAFGKIFEDYLIEYDFWGYFDVDIIFGQIKDFISEQIFEKYDVISAYSGFLSGPFCLYRNSRRINNLFQLHPEYKDILQKEDSFGFDENIQKKNIMGFSVKKIIWLMQFLITGKNIFILITSSQEFRYQFQWFFKKKTINEKRFSDMTEIVAYYEQQNIIYVYFDNMMHSDRYYQRLHYKDWCLQWRNGKLLDLKKKKEVFAFHFVGLKDQVDFIIEEPPSDYLSFFMKPYGITHDKENR